MKQERLWMLLLLLVCIAFGAVVAQDEAPRTVEEQLYGGFKDVDCLWVWPVALEGSAEALGFDRDQLAGELSRWLKKELRQVPLCSESEADDTRAGVGLQVWTVGDDYPVALHLELTASIVSTRGTYDLSFKTATLGYGSRAQLVEDGGIALYLQGVARQFATTFYKARGDIPGTPLRGAEE